MHLKSSSNNFEKKHKSNSTKNNNKCGNKYKKKRYKPSRDCKTSNQSCQYMMNSPKNSRKCCINKLKKSLINRSKRKKVKYRNS